MSRYSSVLVSILIGLVLRRYRFAAVHFSVALGACGFLNDFNMQVTYRERYQSRCQCREPIKR